MKTKSYEKQPLLKVRYKHNMYLLLARSSITQKNLKRSRSSIVPEGAIEIKRRTYKVLIGTHPNKIYIFQRKVYCC